MKFLMAANNYLLVERITKDEKLPASGLYLARTYKNKPVSSNVVCTIRSIGQNVTPERYHIGQEITTPGKCILPMMYKGHEYGLITEEQVLATVCDMEDVGDLGGVDINSLTFTTAGEPTGHSSDVVDPDTGPDEDSNIGLEDLPNPDPDGL